jgi:hypothetical protein
MEWKKHSVLEGRHAILSPSQPSWLKYSDERLLEYAFNKQAAERGTRLHEWAAETISLGIKQSVPRGKVKTIESYINDAINYRMTPEVKLYYSDYIFGTADAICFRNNKLRIHDLKTGSGKIHPEQLVVYAALFCLEYKEDPERLSEIALQIYQNDEINVIEATPEDIRETMDTIIHLDSILRKENVTINFNS